MLIPETLKSILQSLGLQETQPITWQLQEKGNHITITLNMTKSAAKSVAPVNSATLLDRPIYNTQSKKKYKSPSTRKRDQQRYETFLLKKSTKVASNVSAATKPITEQSSLKREDMCNAHTITDPVGKKTQLTQTDNGEENDVEEKLNKTLQENSLIKSELDSEKDFNKEMKQMNLALKHELHLLEKDKMDKTEKLQRDLANLQCERDDLREDVDRLRFERNESLDRERVLNSKIQYLYNGHAERLVNLRLLKLKEGILTKRMDEIRNSYWEDANLIVSGNDIRSGHQQIMAQYSEAFRLGIESIETERSTILQFGKFSLDMASYIICDESGDVRDQGRTWMMMEMRDNGTMKILEDINSSEMVQYFI